MNNIRTLRKEKGLTQAELSKILDLDQTAISKWEVGKALPDTAMLLTLSKFFDVSIDFLLGQTEFYFPDNVKDNLTEKEKALLKAFKNLLPETQDFVLRTAQSLSDTKSAKTLNKN